MYIFKGMLLICPPEKCIITVCWYVRVTFRKPLLTWILPCFSFTTPGSLPKQINQKVIYLFCVFLLKIINALAFFHNAYEHFHYLKKLFIYVFAHFRLDYLSFYYF